MMKTTIINKLNSKATRRVMRAFVALMLGLAIIVGFSAELIPEASAAGEMLSGLITPWQAQELEKPDIWIETNLVMSGNQPTGYVELVLKARTPEINRRLSDGVLITIDPDAAPGVNPDPSTYETLQTTFRELSVSLQYNTDELIPVSWDHTIEYDETDKTKMVNDYPDFYAKYYLSGVDTSAFTSVDYLNSFMDNKNVQEIPIPVLQVSTEISSAIAYGGGADGLITMQVNANQDITLPEETPLAVMRFLYVGERKMEVGADRMIMPDANSETKYSVNENQVTSWHDHLNTAALPACQDLFWFATETDSTDPAANVFGPDNLMAKSYVRQALHYTSGNYVGSTNVGTGVQNGANEYYATKNMYRNTLADDPDDVADTTTQYPQYIINDPAAYVMSQKNYKVVKNPKKATEKLAMPLTDQFNAVLAVDDPASTTPTYSYTSNLLFTAGSEVSGARSKLHDGTPNSEHANIEFSMRAGPSYRANGGGTVDDFSAIVFFDWDDTILGALVVPKGDARDAVESYVEKMIHPHLRKSYVKNMLDSGMITETEATEMLKNLATSLDRRYTYAGSHTSDYGTLTNPGNKNYRNEEEALAANGAHLWKDIYPDVYVTVDGEEVLHELSGSQYPLTNKLDYAFWRRPWSIAHTYDPKVDTINPAPYTDSKGNGIAAVEWSTSVIDYTGGATTEDDDDYWYTNGWAVVADPAKTADVWTTFSTYGELASVKLPGYDSTTVVPGGTAYNAPAYLSSDYIRACGDRTAAPSGLKTVPLDSDMVKSKINTGDVEEIAFATSGETAYFQFANFKNVESNSMFVKACYEPAEQMNWTGIYIVETDTRYVRYGEIASTASSGSVYGILFDYERIDNTGHGVRRMRSPWIRTQYMIDRNMTSVIALQPGQEVLKPDLTGNTFYVGVKLDSTDILPIELTPTSCFISMTYGVVDSYDCSNFVASVPCSLQENEANIVRNFNYLHTEGSEEVGFTYENRLGSDGFVFRATMQQLLEEATAYFNDYGDNWQTATGREVGGYVLKYLTAATLMDLNLRITADGGFADGTGVDFYIDSLEDAQNAIFDAVKTAYKYQVFIGGQDCIDLDWHQIQYHILKWTRPSTTGQLSNSGIDTGSGIMSKNDCLAGIGGGFEWCRLDDCGQDISIAMGTLQDVIEAVQIIHKYDNGDPTVSDNKKTAAEDALKKPTGGAVDILKRNNVRIFNPTKTGAQTTIAGLTNNAAYEVGDMNTFISAIKALLDKLEIDSVDYNTLTAAQIQKWISTYNTAPSSASYDIDMETSRQDQKDYWWTKRDDKPTAVEFSTVTTADAVSKLVAAVYKDTQEEYNPFAWDEFTSVDYINGSSSGSVGMRFRKNTQGDFFDSDARDNFADSDPTNPLGYVSLGYTTSDIEGDWATRARVLVSFDASEIESFKTAVTTFITTVGTRASGSDAWTIEDILPTGGTPLITWEDIQYYLLNGGVETDHIDRYTGTANGQYWWKTLNSRLSGAATYTYKTGEAPSEVTHTVIRPTSATFSDLIDKLNAIGTNSNDAEDLFRLWFTQETASDLVLKYGNRGANISSANINAVVDRLILLAHDHADEVNDMTWSQIQYYLCENVYTSTKAAQGFTYDETRCSWGVNAWREDKMESITDLKVLINTIEAAASSANPKTYLNSKGITSWSDLEVPDLYFKTTNEEGKAVNPAWGGGTTVETALMNMYNAYTGTWSDLALDANLDSAWYLMQYYMFNSAYVTGGDVLQDTSDAGKKLYWWKDGWESCTRFADLYSLASSDVEARLDWMGQHGDGTIDISNATTRNWRGAANTNTSWTDIIAAIKLIGNPSSVMLPGGTTKSLSINVWWQWVQFLVAHKDNSAIVAELANLTPDYTAIRRSVNTLANAENTNFYWWYNGGNANSKVVAMPSVASAVVEYTEDQRTEAAQKVLQNVVYWMATGSVPAKNQVTEQNISRMNIRIPPADPTATLTRDDLSTYSETDIWKALEALAMRVYESNVGSGVSGWDYVTNYSFTAPATETVGPGTPVFTYNAAAWAALGSLSVYQIQHWFDTYTGVPGSGDYSMPTNPETDYWWITKTTNASSGGDEVGEDELRELITGMLFYSFMDPDAFNQFVLDHWGLFGFSSDASSVLGVTVTPDIMIDLFVTVDSYGGGYHWAQLELMAVLGSAFDTDTALILLADDDFVDGLGLNRGEDFASFYLNIPADDIFIWEPTVFASYANAQFAPSLSEVDEDELDMLDEELEEDELDEVEDIEDLELDETEEALSEDETNDVEDAEDPADEASSEETTELEDETPSTEAEDEAESEPESDQEPEDAEEESAETDSPEVENEAQTEGEIEDESTELTDSKEPTDPEIEGPGTEEIESEEPEQQAEIKSEGEMLDEAEQPEDVTNELTPSNETEISEPEEEITGSDIHVEITGEELPNETISVIIVPVLEQVYVSGGTTK